MNGHRRRRAPDSISRRIGVPCPTRPELGNRRYRRGVEMDHSDSPAPAPVPAPSRGVGERDRVASPRYTGRPPAQAAWTALLHLSRGLRLASRALSPSTDFGDAQFRPVGRRRGEVRAGPPSLGQVFGVRISLACLTLHPARVSAGRRTASDYQDVLAAHDRDQPGLARGTPRR